MPNRYRPDRSGMEGLRTLKRHVRQLMTQDPVGNTSVSEGGLDINSNEGLRVYGSAKVEGWLIVTGTERVTGLLEILGTLRAAGVIEFTGPVTITGATSIEGDATISGDTDITGHVSLQGALDVEQDGYIQVGPTRISGSVEGFITSLVEVVMKTPLMRLVGSLRVQQSAIFDGTVDMPGLIPISLADAQANYSPNAYVNSILRDGSGRLRVVTF